MSSITTELQMKYAVVNFIHPCSNAQIWNSDSVRC